ncbi:MAG: hypothetical protein IPO92_22795 [Saprospiraceae bacterium]|nr:hypothetical protein [Saprospiraceae bacterium]
MKKLILFTTVCLCLYNTMYSQNEIEPNNNADQANVFTLGSTQNGSISNSDNQDWYLLNLPQSGTLTMPISFTGNGWIWIRICDAETAGFPLIAELYMSAGGIPPGGYQMVRALLAGQYYVKIEYGGEDKVIRSRPT